ncbi:MAG: DUF3611 family protein [Symploca sp. SIO2E9]|nr:DUF3611 family protein [Symploca sp. SIO2E9]
MPEQLQPSSLPPALQRVALTLRLVGRIAFWIQLVLAIVSGAILLVYGAFGNRGTQESVQGIGFGIFFALCGLVTLGVGIYFAFRYIRLAQKLLVAGSAERPSKADTLQAIRFGLIFNLLGMLFTLLGAQAVIGIILGISFSQPTGPGLNVTQYGVNSFDLLVVQANINTITAHFVGIVASIWLFNQVNR